MPENDIRRDYLNKIDELIDIVSTKMSDHSKLSSQMFDELMGLKKSLANSSENELDNIISKVKFGINRIHFLIAKKHDYKKNEERVIGKISETLEMVARNIVENSEQRNILFNRLKKAKIEILKAPLDQKELVLEQADFEAKNVEASVTNAKHKKKEEQIWRLIVPLIIVFYTSIIIYVITYQSSKFTSTTNIPLVGVPISIVIWAAFGSLAAILYKFYKIEQNKLNEEIKWLFARPIIGIIMGSLGYIAIISGLIIFGSTPNTPSDTSNNCFSQLNIYRIVAFLGGFSDKFFESTIDMLATKLSSKENDKKNPT